MGTVNSAGSIEVITRYEVHYILVLLVTGMPTGVRGVGAALGRQFGGIRGGAALDIIVVNPCQTATVIGAATTAGHALNFAHTRKVRGAGEACQRQGVAFLPIVVESYGGWHETAVREVERLGAALARQSGQDEDEAVRHMAVGEAGVMLPFWPIVCPHSLLPPLMACTSFINISSL